MLAGPTIEGDKTTWLFTPTYHRHDFVIMRALLNDATAHNWASARLIDDEEIRVVIFTGGVA